MNIFDELVGPLDKKYCVIFMLWLVSFFTFVVISGRCLYLLITTMGGRRKMKGLSQ